MEPRGFEPLTSAVQSQIHTVVAVRYCSEIPAKQPIRLYDASQLFAVVPVGWCTTGVFGVPRLACVPGQGRRAGLSCYRPTRKGWTRQSAGWSRSCSRLRRTEVGPARKPAPSVTGRSTIEPRTARTLGAGPSAAPGSALAATGDRVAKTPRNVSPPPNPPSEKAASRPFVNKGKSKDLSFQATEGSPSQGDRIPP